MHSKPDLGSSALPNAKREDSVSRRLRSESSKEKKKGGGGEGKKKMKGNNPK